ncbi:hypothetical protein ATN38_04735 [Rhodococcus sp. FH8]|uniref:hypothetical protein n=1 Tax=Rhodococcus sp. FH8 TaxID=1761013 RepID=UPI001C4ED583|nr:hypothetical protein [Rhodococcus sp. FH8]MBW0286104.1 hypothetical protein [Rhodococcus sp. FH8]
MTRIGITGHQQMPEVAIDYAVSGIRDVLARAERPLVGVSSLASGADQLFARELVAAGGQLHVVVPAADYETTFSDEDAGHYRRFLAQASEVTHLEFEHSDEPAYNAAGLWVAEQCELLIAVWDGLPARGLGGTADAVAHAERLGRTVCILWPQGVRRQ